MHINKLIYIQKLCTDNGFLLTQLCFLQQHPTWISNIRYHAKNSCVRIRASIMLTDKLEQGEKYCKGCERH